MNDGRSWIVCWMLGAKDQWAVYESIEDATSYYSALCNDPSVGICTICAVIESSDYEPHEAFTKENP